MGYATGSKDNFVVAHDQMPAPPAIHDPGLQKTQNCACNLPEKTETGPRSALYPGSSMN
jgi:hypothetical protein